MLKKLSLILSACLLLTACGAEAAPKTPSEDEKLTSQIYAMDTVMDLSIYGGDQALLDQATSRIAGLEELLSTTRDTSEIASLNRDGTAALSEDTATLMDKALTLCQETDGALDISIYPIVKAWGFTTDSFQIPDPAVLEELRSHVDYRQVSFADGSVSIPAGMQVDLGSVAKGYTADQVVKLFRDNGITSALLNLGGNVQALGSKPDGSDWRIAINDPSGDGFLGVLTMSNKAVVTSGGYERFFEGPDGTIYWHIIDPKTGYPAKNGLISTTIIGDEGATCDALSTSLFIMGPEKAVAFWKAHRDFEMVLVTDQQQVLVSPGIAEHFQLTEGSPYTLFVIAAD